VEDRFRLVQEVAYRRDVGAPERLKLREALRTRLGRNPSPSAGMVDSRSVKATGVGGQERGFDFAKKADRRKRHLLVDTEGLVLEVCLYSATSPDQDGIRLLLEQVQDRFGRFLTCGSTQATEGGAKSGSRR
jgi:hypothetical protein